MSSYNNFNDFYKKHLQAASYVSSYLLSHPEFVNYKFSVAYDIPDGYVIMYDSLHSADGLILNVVLQNDDYSITQIYPKS